MGSQRLARNHAGAKGRVQCAEEILLRMSEQLRGHSGLLRLGNYATHTQLLHRRKFRLMGGEVPKPAEH